MRTHSDVLWLRPSYQSGILAALTTTIIDQGYGIPALAAQAGIPALKVTQILRSGVAQREMASYECFLKTQGASVCMWIDTQSRRIQLASIPADYHAQARANVALTRRQAYLRSSAGGSTDADERARQSLEAFERKLSDDRAQALEPAPRVEATSLVQIAHQLLKARQQVGQLRWTDHALMLSAGMLQAKMRAGVIHGRPVPLLGIIDALMTTLKMALRVEVGEARRWTLGTAGALPSFATIPQRERTTRPGPRVALGSSVLVQAVLERIATLGLTLTAVARSARVPLTTLTCWQRTGTDRSLAQVESLLTALGCRLALASRTGRHRQVLPRIALPSGRSRPAQNDMASILRSSVATQTGLSGAALERSVRRRIAQRLRLLRAAAAAPLVRDNGEVLPVGHVIGQQLHAALIAVIEMRRMDHQHSLRWPIIDLVLISGVPRQATTSLLASPTPSTSEAMLQKVLRSLDVQLEVLTPTNA